MIFPTDKKIGPLSFSVLGLWQEAPSICLSQLRLVPGYFRVNLPPMSQLFSELKRRNVFRVGTAYAVIAWGELDAAIAAAEEILAEIETSIVDRD